MNDNFLLGLYYLSSEHAEIEDDLLWLKDKSRFLIGNERDIIDYYIDQATRLNAFPLFDVVVDMFGINIVDNNKLSAITNSKKLRELLSAEVALFEIQYYQNKLASESNLKQKREILARLNDCLTVVGDKDDDLVESREIDIVTASINIDPCDRLVFPVKELNDRCATIKKGCTVSILSVPGAGKSTTALNIVFCNSVLRPLKCLYLYTEDTKERYQMNLLARYSYHINDRITNSSLKAGIDVNDVVAKEKIQEVNDRYKKEMQGDVYYRSMMRIPKDPFEMATYLAKIVDDKKIDYIVLDYIQRLKTYATKRYSITDYLNQVSSSLCNLAIGAYGNRPVTFIQISQMPKEKVERCIRNKGKMHLSDASDVNSVERDSMLVIGIYSDEEMRDAGEMNYSVLKYRDEASSVNPQITNFDPRYCFIGDVEGLDNIYSVQSLTDSMGVDLLGM